MQHPAFATGGIVELFVCNQCDAKIPRAAMSRVNRKTPTGVCKACFNTSRKTIPSRAPERTREYSSRWKAANREQWLDANRKFKYGIAHGTYAKMLAGQSGKCAICGAPEPSDKSLHIDHDHETGRVRALLCDLCNRGLGYFKDSSVLLSLAARYLDGFQK